MLAIDKIGCDVMRLAMMHAPKGGLRKHQGSGRSRLSPLCLFYPLTFDSSIVPLCAGKVIIL